MPSTSSATSSTSSVSDATTSGGSSNNLEQKEKLIGLLKKEVKHIMEESVMLKSIHEDSSTVTSLSAIIDTCLSLGEVALFKYQIEGHKASQNLAPRRQKYFLSSKSNKNATENFHFFAVQKCISKDRFHTLYLKLKSEFDSSKCPRYSILGLNTGYYYWYDESPFIIVSHIVGSISSELHRPGND